MNGLDDLRTGPAAVAAARTEREARLLLTHLLPPGQPRFAEELRRGVPALSLLPAALERRAAVSAPDDVDAGVVPVDQLPEAAALLARMAEVGERFLVPGDEEWPLGLGRLSRPNRSGTLTPAAEPFGLFVRGPHRLDEVADRAVAVVGSRACTGYGAHMAAELAAGLVERDWAVVSGGAFGIDAAAHRAALGLGGITVAVLAGGLDVPYPVAHTSMLERIGREGLLVSESPPGSRPFRHRFLTRNRLIAALAGGTVLVEAALRSGALSTARHTIAINGHLCVVPGPVTSPLSAGCHQQLRDVVGATLVTSAAEVLELVGRLGQDMLPEVAAVVTPRDGLSPLQAQVLAAFPGRGGVTAEEVAVSLGLPVDDALAALTDLGMVQRDGPGWRLTDSGCR